MYVRDCHIENAGPVRSLDIQFEMSDDGRPLPVILLGENGTGKSTVLSMIADALLIFQQKKFSDIVKGQTQGSETYLRVNGGVNQSSSAEYSLSALRFVEEEADACWFEKTGNVPKDLVLGSLSERFGTGLNKRFEGEWKMMLVPGPQKNFVVPERVETLADDFRANSYCFFPADRGDQPAWMNEQSHPSKTAFRFHRQVDDQLDKPLYVSSSIESCLSWLMDIIVDARVDAERALDGGALVTSFAAGESERWIRSKGLLERLTAFLQLLLDDPTAHFELGPRDSSDFRLQIALDEGGRSLPSITCLSAGQATLFGMFATILRYSDRRDNGIDSDLSAVSGIVLVDEADAHLHTRLQYEVLPELISRLPNVQFVLTSHSPVLLLGMEKRFGRDGFLAKEMPLGKSCNSDDYPEAAATVRCFAETREFKEILETKLKENAPLPTVFMEGITDVRYMETAFRVLGHGEALARVKLDTFAKTGPKGDINGGTSSLDKLADLYKTKRVFTEPVLLLYDCDTPRSGPECNGLTMRSVLRNPDSAIKNGIENLLPSNTVPHDKYYSQHSSTNNLAEAVSQERFEKQSLCTDLCTMPDPTVFIVFQPVIKTIEDWLNGISSTRCETLPSRTDNA